MARSNFTFLSFDPLHLEPDEIAYELLIRNIRGLSTTRDETRTLRTFLNKELKNLEQPPYFSPFDPNEEVESARVAAKNLEKLVRQAYETRDSNLLGVLRSRIAVWINRVHRLNDSQIEGLELVQNHLDGLFDSVAHQFKTGSIVRTEQIRSGNSVRENFDLIDNELDRTRLSLPSDKMIVKDNQNYTLPRSISNSAIQDSLKNANKDFYKLKTETLKLHPEYGIPEPTNKKKFHSYDDDDDFDSQFSRPPSPIGGKTDFVRIDKNFEFDQEIPPKFSKINQVGFAVPSSFNPKPKDIDADLNKFHKQRYISQGPIQSDKNSAYFQNTTHPKSIQKPYASGREDDQPNKNRTSLNSKPEISSNNRDSNFAGLRSNQVNSINTIQFENYPTDLMSNNVSGHRSAFRGMENHPPEAWQRRNNIRNNYQNPVIHENTSHEDRPNSNYTNYRPNYRPQDSSDLSNLFSEQLNLNIRKIPQMHRWKISFSGDGKGLSLNEFLHRVEIYSKGERISKEQLFDNIHYLLTNKAESWYWGSIHEIRSWDDLVFQLKKEFLPRFYDYYLREEIERRVQGNDETLNMYINDMKTLFHRAHPSLDEQYKLYIVQRNMLPEYGAQLATINLRSFQELVEFCRRIDDSKMMRSRRPTPQDFRNYPLVEPSCFPSYSSRNPNNRPHVRFNTGCVDGDNYVDGNVEGNRYSENHPDYPYDSSHLSFPGMNNSSFDINRGDNLRYDVGHLDVVNSSRNRDAIICFNCRITGHTHRECDRPKDRVFCYWCGKNSVTVKDCPNCKERFRTYSRRAGNSHPSNCISNPTSQSISRVPENLRAEGLNRGADALPQ